MGFLFSSSFFICLGFCVDDYLSHMYCGPFNMRFRKPIMRAICDSTKPAMKLGCPFKNEMVRIV